MANNISIALVSEPYVGRETTVHAIRGVNIFQFATNGRVKACVLIKDNFGVALGVTQLSTSNLAVVEIKLRQRKLFIASAYIEPDADPNNTINAINEFITTTNGSYQVLGGDINASHLLWNCTTSDERGENIADMLHANNMSVCNTGNHATFEAIRHRNHCSSIVDVTLASDNIITKIANWKVEISACISSDHHAIEFDIENNVRLNHHARASTYLFNNKIAKWNRFKETLRMEMQESGTTRINIRELTPDGLDNFVTKLTGVIHDACLKSMKLRGNAKPYNPWWNDALERLKQNAIRHHHRLHDKKKRNANITDELELLSYAKIAYSNAMRKESTKHFREFCKKQGKEDVWSVTNRLIKDAPTQRPPSTLKHGNAFTNTSKETANALLHHFYPDDDIDTQQRHHQLRNNANVKPNTTDEPPFTEDELIECIKTMNPNRAPGVDNLTSDICHAVIEEYPEMMTNLFNHAMALSYFPMPWKKACVKILPKPNKDDYSELASYRPIGLLPVFGKLFEKLFTKRLTFAAQTTDAWSQRQFGFREQTSTTHALSTAVNAIKQFQLNKKQVIGVSLDIKAAFDNAWWPALFSQLRRTKCAQNIFGLIQSYFQNRSVELTYGDGHATKKMSRGCIQGSVCGPIFWNLILDELLNTPLPNGCHIQAFADDVLLIVSGETPTQIEVTTNNALVMISEWGKSVKLTFSATKTQAIAFTPDAKQTLIHMNGVQISFENNIKVLGVIVDENLKFHEHIKYAIKKATRVFKNLCKFVRPTWGVHAENVTTIYRQVIEPIITYAAGVWGKAAEMQHAKKALRSFQRSYAIRAIRGFHTISAVSALALAQFTPLHLKIREVLQIENAKNKGTYHAIPDDITLERPVKPKEQLHPATRQKITFRKVNTQEEADANNTFTNIYTDGSKCDTNAGASFVVYQNGSTITTRKFKLNAACSVFQAELYAIDRALEWATQHLNTDLTIFSDSLSSLNAIGNRSNSHQLVVSIHAKIMNLKQHHNISFIWVKAHAGVIGNEEADAAAKHATIIRTATVYNKFPLSHVKRIIRQECQSEWAFEYESAEQGSGTRQWLPTLDAVRNLTNAFNISFELTQVLTGHGFHKQYLNRFKITPDAICPCDNASIQTIDHLIKDCPKYANERHHYTTSCTQVNSNPYKMEEIIIHKNLINSFNAFINSIINSLKEFNST